MFSSSSVHSSVPWCYNSQCTLTSKHKTHIDCIAVIYNNNISTQFTNIELNTFHLALPTVPVSEGRSKFPTLCAEALVLEIRPVMTVTI